MTIEILNWMGLFAVIGLFGSIVHMKVYPDNNEAHLIFLQTRMDATNEKLAAYSIRYTINDGMIRFEVYGWLATYVVDFRQLQCVTRQLTPTEAFALITSIDASNVQDIIRLLEPIPLS